VIVAEQSELERDLRLLEAALHQLESQYNMYFAGSLPKPPVEARSRVEALFKRYDRAYIQSYADRFRLSTLQTRFSRFCELWDRGIRAREEGRPGPFQHMKRDEFVDKGRPVTAPAEAPAPEPRAEPSPAPVEHAVRVGVAGDEALDSKIEGLYSALLEARRAAGNDQGLPFDRFADLVHGQLARLRTGGGREVVFRVATEEGKVVFTAKVSGSGSGAAAAAREALNQGAVRSGKE